MTIAGAAGDQAVTVTLATPRPSGTHWVCGYEIAWPGHTRRFEAHGVDALQANHLALQMVGAELYTSRYHAEGTLRWDGQGEGYGFPVPKAIRNLLVGDDKKFDG